MIKIQAYSRAGMGDRITPMCDAFLVLGRSSKSLSNLIKLGPNLEVLGGQISTFATQMERLGQNRSSLEGAAAGLRTMREEARGLASGEGVLAGEVGLAFGHHLSGRSRFPEAEAEFQRVLEVARAAGDGVQRLLYVNPEPEERSIL